MLLESVTGNLSFSKALLIAAFALIGRLVYSKFGTGLNHIPGPFFAGFTDLYRLIIVWNRRPEVWHIELHNRYGTFVRIGPRTVICADYKAAKQIYALNAGFVKSEFYPIQQALARGVPLKTLFTSTDEGFHARLRRSVSNAYAMSTLVQFEPLVDSAIQEFFEQLQRQYADREGDGAVVDFGKWLQYFAFDVICELTYSEPMGFMKVGGDVEHIIEDLQWLLDYAAVVGQMPSLDQVLLKNPIRRWMSSRGLIKGTPVAHFALRRIAESQARSEGSNSGDEIKQRDFLSRFQEAHIKDPLFMTQERVLALTVANMFAGSDTTAISLRAIFYNLMRNPDKLAKLRDELKDTNMQNSAHKQWPLFAWSDLHDLPYLSAVINESLRTHPAAGLPLERIVPRQGLHVNDISIPGGTNIGCNAWALHLDENTWGDSPHLWIPERWIEATNAQKAEMRNSLFSFGAGSRTCIGKNISYLEMYKLVPAMISRFEIDFADPDKEWSLHNAWFVKQSEFYVKLRSRTPSS